MKAKFFLISLIALLYMVTAVSACGYSTCGTLTDGMVVNVNGIVYANTDMVISGDAGETIPLRVVFQAAKDAEDVRVKAYISGYRTELSDETSRFDTIEGSVYSKLLSIRLPSDIDPVEDYTLYVRVESKTESEEIAFNFKVQRESYKLDILDVDVEQAEAGKTLKVDIVMKNIGSKRLDDVFVRASIPGLGVEKRAYFGDLTSTDDCTVSYDENNDVIVVRDCSDNEQDAEQRTIYLQIPVDATAGVYTLEVEAETDDATITTTKNVVVRSAEEASEVIAVVSSKTVGVGEEATYDLILVNKGTSIGVYELVLDSVNNLVSTVDSSIVTVSAGSSRVIPVHVKPLKEGTYSFGVTVKSDGNVIDRVTLTTVAQEGSVLGGTSGNSMVVLTVVLVIIFVVLLIILIVLLTRKPAEAEESYY